MKIIIVFAWQLTYYVYLKYILTIVKLSGEQHGSYLINDNFEKQFLKDISIFSANSLGLVLLILISVKISVK